MYHTVFNIFNIPYSCNFVKLSLMILANIFPLLFVHNFCFRINLRHPLVRKMLIQDQF